MTRAHHKSGGLEEIQKSGHSPLLFDLKGSGNFAGFKIGHIAPACKPDSEMEGSRSTQV